MAHLTAHVALDDQVPLGRLAVFQLGHKSLSRSN